MKVEIKNKNNEIVKVLELEPGEYKMVLSHQESNIEKVVADTIHEHFHEARLTIVLVSAMLSYIFLDHVFINSNMRDIWGFLQFMLSHGSFALAASVFAMVVIKVFTGRFQPWQATNLVAVAYILINVMDQNLLGMRWVLPKVFLYEEVYLSLWLIFGGPWLWWLVNILFVRMSRPLRFGLLALIGVCAIGYQSLQYIPLKDGYTYFNAQTSPPRPEMLESKVISVDQFMAELDKVK